jgi:pimeloyl-ACP methyl ester carboxylesterase
MAADPPADPTADRVSALGEGDHMSERLVSFDGIEIAYQEWGSDAAEPPVVLQHGFVADSNLNWVGPGVVKALVDGRRRVVAVDARGHGASSKPHDPSLYGEEKMAKDLNAVLDAIGAEQLDLVGYSMGAVVALIVASREPRVRRLVVGGIGASAVELGGVDTRVRPGTSVIEALRSKDPEAIEDPLVASFRNLADIVGADREALAAQAQRVHAEPIPLGRIGAPTLVIGGEVDEVAPRPQVLASAIPDARLLIVPGDHLSAVVAPQFRAGIVDFLAAGG